MGQSDLCLDDFKVLALRHSTPTGSGTAHHGIAASKAEGHGCRESRLLGREAEAFTGWVWSLAGGNARGNARGFRSWRGWQAVEGALQAAQLGRWCCWVAAAKEREETSKQLAQCRLRRAALVVGRKCRQWIVVVVLGSCSALSGQEARLVVVTLLCLRWGLGATSRFPPSTAQHAAARASRRDPRFFWLLPPVACPANKRDPH